jgi:predicted amidohydrolase YtcJ
LMPGFIDTHGHVGLFGLDELKVSLTSATTKREILARLQARVAATPRGEWVISNPIGEPPYFLNANALRAQGEVPTLEELDRLAPAHPIYIQAPTNRA